MSRHPKKKCQDLNQPAARRLRVEAAMADLYTSCDLFEHARYSGAEFVLRRVLKSLRSLPPGPDVDEALALCLGNLVPVLDELGRFAEAEACGQEALLVTEPDERASQLGNLASVYKELGRYAEAEAAYLRSLELRRGEGEPEKIASMLAKLGDLRKCQGRWAEAMELYREGLSLVPRRSGRRCFGRSGGTPVLGLAPPRYRGSGAALLRAVGWHPGTGACATPLPASQGAGGYPSWRAQCRVAKPRASQAVRRVQVRNRVVLSCVKLPA